MLHVAVIGAGPAGFYTAEALVRRLGEAVAIDVIDALPTPYGLIRGGVAPDHQAIKAVDRRYHAVLAGGVRFVGDVVVGASAADGGDVVVGASAADGGVVVGASAADGGDVSVGDGGVSIADLLALYDAVVVATGAPRDRPLGIPGDDLPGVLGSGAFVGWYNGHPDFAAVGVPLAHRGVAVIGNGNVAIDVARVLAKTPEELVASDIAGHARAALARSGVADVHIVGRRGPYQASFTAKEMGELGDLARARPVVDPADLPDAGGDARLDPALRKVVGRLRAFAAAPPDDRPVTIVFDFFTRPVAIETDGDALRLIVERTRLEGDSAVGTGAMRSLAVGLVVGAIGYRSAAIAGVPFDAARGRFVNDGGRIADRLYVAGWARRGPSGTIGTNRPDGAQIAERIAAEVVAGDRAGAAGLDALLAVRGIVPVTFAGWQAIDAAEVAAAAGGTPREKIVARDALRAAAGARPDK